MRFFSLILKNLTRRPMRTGLTVLALTMAVAAVVSLRGIARGFTESFAEIYRSHAVDVVVSRQGSADRLSSSVEQSLVDEITMVSGVDRTAGVLLETLSLEQQQIFGIPTMGLDADSWLRDDYQWREQMPADQIPKERLSLGVNLAERAGVDVGDNVSIFEEPYVVDGIFESTSAWENGAILMPLAALQALTGRDGQVTYINVVLSEDITSENVEDVLAKIGEIDQRLHAMTTDEFVGTDTRMRIASAMAWMTSIIALVIGAVGTLNTMMTSVLERTREIGILRAVGWSRRRVIGMIFSETLFLSLAASVLGWALAVIATSAMSQHPAVRGVLVPSIGPGVVLEGTLLAIFIGVLGAILPARRAASVLPTEAIRG
jgi:putative ABC transport system permease protein